ncbi:2-oxoglutarate ferredoxin oxidoreductase subunit gamma [Desulfotomaculum copahuensis]|uniref:2-oxoglutarate ferredoxin oxidoreductase subunit gamma n=1 Tax=Desulfotomaculum copahuensis TaxID=1838280 RepID=A0A1B7LI10_9FIRM|nr:2-oxoglutarate ferredoxin oxidoreductase subunit gamma [Desulfotomaculum copahuensis]
MCGVNNPPETKEIRLSGSGGQGLILAGIILAEAGIREGKKAVQTQSYGPEARGGASKAEVILSDGPVDYPKVEYAGILLVMNQESCRKYMPLLKEGGVAIVDTTYVQDIPPVKGRVYALPISLLARQKTGRELVANIVALGVLAGITGLVGRESLERAVIARIPPGTEELNRKALDAGYQAAEQLLTQERTAVQ